MHFKKLLTILPDPAHIMTQNTEEISPMVSIVIPSYRRPDDLHRCLSALKSQVYRNWEALVVCRTDDTPNRTYVADFKVLDSRFREVSVEEPGLIAAMNIGLRAATGEFVTFTDDDAEAPPDWLATIVQHFYEHPECGGIGGPDRLQVDKDHLRNPPIANKVGRFSYLTGNFFGNHHCPIEAPYMRTEMLKGVNMTYRHDLIRGLEIGEGLRGGAMQVSSEASLAHRVLSQNHELHFVRDAWVKHFIAERPENENRTDFSTQFALNTSFNHHYTVGRYRGRLCWYLTLLRAIIIGSKRIPGLLRIACGRGNFSMLRAHIPYMREGGQSGIHARKSM